MPSIPIQNVLSTTIQLISAISFILNTGPTNTLQPQITASTFFTTRTPAAAATRASAAKILASPNSPTDRKRKNAVKLRTEYKYRHLKTD